MKKIAMLISFGLLTSSFFLMAQAVPDDCKCDAPSPCRSIAVPIDVSPEEACNALRSQSERITTWQADDGTQMVLCSGQGTPPGLNSGPPPSFSSLDENNNNRISESEASVYPPLANDFLYASHGHPFLTREVYRQWVNHATVDHSDGFDSTH